MTADRRYSVARISLDCQWALVNRLDPRQGIADRARMLLELFLGGEFQVVEPWRDIAVDQHSLDYFAQLREVSGQGAELRRARANRRHRTVACVEFLRSFHVFPSDG